MTQGRLPSDGAKWAGSISTLAKAYGTTEDSIATATYALAEQIHRHYCLARGLVLHSEARPDQQVAISIMMSMAGQGWWVVQSDQLVPSSETIPGEVVVNDDST